MNKTSHDLVARLAITPLVQEARGLDAGPRLVHRLRSEGDADTARVVQIIVEEEVSHVAVGMRWFSRVCSGAGLDARSEFQRVVRAHVPTLLPGPLNHEARGAAGMPREWYAPLETQAAREQSEQ